MKIILLILFALALISVYLLYKRNKSYSEYVKRKTHDQQYINNNRNGWNW